MTAPLSHTVLFDLSPLCTQCAHVRTHICTYICTCISYSMCTYTVRVYYIMYIYTYICRYYTILRYILCTLIFSIICRTHCMYRVSYCIVCMYSRLIMVVFRTENVQNVLCMFCAILYNYALVYLLSPFPH